MILPAFTSLHCTVIQKLSSHLRNTSPSSFKPDDADDQRVPCKITFFTCRVKCDFDTFKDNKRRRHQRFFEIEIKKVLVSVFKISVLLFL